MHTPPHSGVACERVVATLVRCRNGTPVCNLRSDIAFHALQDQSLGGPTTPVSKYTRLLRTKLLHQDVRMRMHAHGASASASRLGHPAHAPEAAAATPVAAQVRSAGADPARGAERPSPVGAPMRSAGADAARDAEVTGSLRGPTSTRSQ
jgi:hypothetical protein